VKSKIQEGGAFGGEKQSSGKEPRAFPPHYLIEKRGLLRAKGRENRNIIRVI
jgi:hypothetical protein